MKHLIQLLPAPLHRLLFRVAHAARKQVWKLRKPRVEGVRVLALDAQGRVVLVRHSYGSSSWMPPGGGVRKGEDPVLAGMRELREETGCTLDGARRITVSNEDLHGASNVVHIIYGTTQDTPVPDNREVIAAQAFPLDALPEAMPARFAELIRAWLAQA